MPTQTKILRKSSREDSNSMNKAQLLYKFSQKLQKYGSLANIILIDIFYSIIIEFFIELLFKSYHMQNSKV